MYSGLVPPVPVGAGTGYSMTEGSNCTVAVLVTPLLALAVSVARPFPAVPKPPVICVYCSFVGSNVIVNELPEGKGELKVTLGAGVPVGTGDVDGDGDGPGVLNPSTAGTPEMFVVESAVTVMLTGSPLASYQASLTIVFPFASSALTDTVFDTDFTTCGSAHAVVDVHVQSGSGLDDGGTGSDSATFATTPPSVNGIWLSAPATI